MRLAVSDWVFDSDTREVIRAVQLADRDAIRIGPASMIFRLFKRAGSTASTVEKRKSVTLAAGRGSDGTTRSVLIYYQYENYCDLNRRGDVERS